ncbi:MAG: tyrosine-type recombinase/integrase [Phenylobacterium sp.]|uniref:tyrosine-type recombinase/integrase n=1 Tax=Phenylobacterium sp. TaxID=1871053 RepID=UPI0027FACACA|nr:tyrosine-type recombinase/integrase [Phenylobacterium sp.]
MSKAADAAGITGARRIHGARHSAASSILKRTGNIKAVQGLLGHASINSSQRYAHVSVADLRAAVEDQPQPAQPKRRKAKGARNTP